MRDVYETIKYVTLVKMIEVCETFKRIKYVASV